MTRSPMTGAIETRDRHRYPPVKYCIYCGTREGPFSDEHIVPFALNGNWVLPKASCSTCQAIIQKYEDRCLQHMFKPLRTRLGMQSRTQKKEFVDVETIRPDGSRETVTVRSEDFPVVAYGLHLPVAGVVLGNSLTDVVPATLLLRFHQGEPQRFSASHRGVVRIGSFDATAFLRMIAKIAYSYAAAEIGSHLLLPMLADVVLARAPNAPYLSHLVGGESGPTERGHSMNRLELWNYEILGTLYSVVYVRLFAHMDMPTYHVVVREGAPSKNG